MKKLFKSDHFIIVVEEEGQEHAELTASLDGSVFRFYARPFSYKPKTQPSKPIEEMTDEELIGLYDTVKKEYVDETSRMMSWIKDVKRT